MTLEEYASLKKFKNVNIISSYHNHNYLCQHASGTVIDYVTEAKEKGLLKFGISDHGPSNVYHERMNLEAFYNEYLPQFENVDNLGIKVYKGLEMEYNKDDLENMKKLRKEVDYMILGQHYVYRDNRYKMVHKEDVDDIDVKIYKDTIIEALNTGLFQILAHPEIVFYRMEKISNFALKCLEEIVVTAKNLGVYLEVNANGMRRSGIGKLKYRYPRQEYLDLLKKHNAKCIVSDDAHTPSHIVDLSTEILYSYLIDEGFNLVIDPML